MSGITIREAQLDDADALVHLYQQIDQETPPSPGMVSSFLEDLKHQEYSTIYVAVEDGRVVGTYQFFLLTMLNHRVSKMAVIEAVVVEATERSRGIGEFMMNHARDLATAAQCYKFTFSSNLKRHRAHDFYERLGFEKHGYSFIAHPRKATG